MLFDFLFIFKPIRKVRTIIFYNVCKECERKYNDSDTAAICADWDNVLGVQRHETFKR
jgi:hypothetical protein